jgi:hypothetical protein
MQNGIITSSETFREMRSFAASPKGTAMPQQFQKIETRHVRSSKRAFRARRPQIFTLCSFKIDVSCKASVNFQHISQNATPAMEVAR